MPRQPFDPSRITPPSQSRDSRAAYTVSQVTALVKDAITAGLPSTIHVVGELSNFKRHGSGHLYWTLKDGTSELSCVMWRSQVTSLKFDPADGLAVIATGRIDVFERSGRYQLYVRKLEPKGIGTLELAFRQLCEKLEREGLFDPQHKKPIPRWPQRIVVITSATSAAVHDILRTIARRYPCVEVLIYPVTVQGDRAKAEIAHAIRRVNSWSKQLGGIDVMIVGRGGGSLEDLWAFNEEVVARAIYASRIPIISAVGHEVDVTIADLVADLRAATPTAAAELAVPVLAEIAESVAGAGARLQRAMQSRRDVADARLRGTLHRIAFAEPVSLLHRREQVIDEWSRRMQSALSGRTRAARERVDRTQPSLARIAPHAHLLRTGLRLRDAEQRLQSALQRRVRTAERDVARMEHALDRVSPDRIVAAAKHRTEVSATSLALALRHEMILTRQRLTGLEDRLAAMSYRSVLNRGFSITRVKKGRRVVRLAKELADRDRLVTEVADGTFESEVVNLHQLELFE